jgi:hypothetical protein
MKRFSLLLVLALAMVLCGTVAFAQSPGDGPFQIQIVTNLPGVTNPAGVDTAIHLTNSGASWGVGVPPVDPTKGYVCANIYVFDVQEEEVACCSCPLSPNSIHYLSTVNDLISNTLTGKPLTGNAIVIKIVGTEPIVGPAGARTCDAAAPSDGTAPLRLVSGLIAQAKVAGGIDISFENASQNSNELKRARDLCFFNTVNGTGPGVCAVTNPLCNFPPTPTI